MNTEGRARRKRLLEGKAGRAGEPIKLEELVTRIEFCQCYLPEASNRRQAVKALFIPFQSTTIFMQMIKINFFLLKEKMFIQDTFYRLAVV